MKATIDTVAQSSKNYDATVHGDDSNGVVDVEFPNVYAASGWAAVVSEVHGWVCTLRDPVYLLNSPVVLMVRDGR